MAIFLYTDCVIAASVILCAGYAITTIKGFANAYRKSEKDIIKGVIYPKNKKSVQRRKEVIASLIKIKLRRS
jgi:hypothetical protein